MFAGHLRKMRVDLAIPVNYMLGSDRATVSLNTLLGSCLQLRYSGEICCVHCGRKTKKSFNQGYCFPCVRRLAQCDICIVSPERCHFDQGSCREPDWAANHCMTDHIVYLANTSGLKVGITRVTQLPVRWIDQGAVQALPVLRVTTRYQAGLAEIILGKYVSDKTDWRKMLKGEPEPVALNDMRDQLLYTCRDELAQLTDRFGIQAIRPLTDETPTSINYPVMTYPEKVSSLNLDKTPLIEGNLMGIKGQYLMLDTGVLNVRKYAGYHVEVRQTG